MAIREICKLPNPVLRRKAKKVSIMDNSTKKLIKDMVETLHNAKGVGLAAPQVGVSLRIVVLQMPETDDPPIVLVNPEIIKRSGERTVSEGCLSIPGYVADITRSEAVTVKGQNREGKPVRIKACEIMAQALEHELDHLNGILYIDHIPPDGHVYRVRPKTETLESNQGTEPVKESAAAPAQQTRAPA